jgi:hypothetical protein
LSSQERRESSDPLLGTRGSLTTSYGGFSEETDPHYLGVAKDGTGWVNRLFFVWVNQLIRKGRRSGGAGLSCPDDLFDLPDQLTVHAASDKFQHHWEAAEKCAPLLATTTTTPPVSSHIRGAYFVINR